MLFAISLSPSQVWQTSMHLITLSSFWGVLYPPDAQLRDWRLDYAGMKQEMFYGKVPGFDEIIDAVRRFQDTFNQG